MFIVFNKDVFIMSRCLFLGLQILLVSIFFALKLSHTVLFAVEYVAQGGSLGLTSEALTIQLYV